MTVISCVRADAPWPALPIGPTFIGEPAGTGPPACGVVGHYGWSWPHGLSPVGSATITGAANATLLTGDQSFLDLARTPLDAVLRHAEHRSAGEMGTLGEHWQPHLRAMGGGCTLMVPQLTTGSPQVLYNGGLAQLHLRYYDAGERRPGLPADVAALVSDIRPDHTVVELVNLGSTPRSLVVQAGSFAEHLVCTVRLDEGPVQDVDGRYCGVELPGATRVRLTPTLTLRGGRPTYRSPWEVTR
ncbi:hypothetical protein ACF08M_15815 [Streptomyces sp. NPDC015032]|uniref:hypothetical protein n=1 Tax=Streptomyces sp. NPDC015032 TaxID=3364937 RepID=UPI0036F54569